MWRWDSGKVPRGSDRVMRRCLSSARITGLQEETLGRDVSSSPQGCAEEDLHDGIEEGSSCSPGSELSLEVSYAV